MKYFSIFMLCAGLTILSQSVYSQESLDSIANVKTVIVESEDFDVLMSLGFSTSYSQELYSMAISGNAAAQNYLGNCYMNGDGVDADSALAFSWFCKAAIGDTAAGRAICRPA